MGKVTLQVVLLSVNLKSDNSPKNQNICEQPKNIYNYVKHVFSWFSTTSVFG